MFTLHAESEETAWRTVASPRASLLNNNKEFIDAKRGLLVGTTALVGTIIGSYCGLLFNQAQPNGLGYIAMLTTVFLGFKFLIRPINGGLDADGFGTQQQTKQKTALAMLCGIGIGWVCGFTGSGGGVLMLTVFTLLLGFNLKVAVGTSTMIMTVVALVGAISHITMGAEIHPIPMTLVVAACLFGAVISARFANRCDMKKLNRVIGSVLLILGVVTILLKI